MGYPQVTMGFDTKKWSSMTWMIWGYPQPMGNLHMIASQEPACFLYTARFSKDPHNSLIAAGGVLQSLLMGFGTTKAMSMI